MIVEVASIRVAPKTATASRTAASKAAASNRPTSIAC